MNETPAVYPRGPAPFARRTVLAVVSIGVLAFVAMLYFLSAGDTGPRGQEGEAHAAATGLNGYAGLVRLLQSEGRQVALSREPGGLETENLLILAPPTHADAEEFGALLEKREWFGPTLVILPKWIAQPPPPDLDDEVAEKFGEGWVQLTGAIEAGWLAQMPEAYRAVHRLEILDDGQSRQWRGLARTGELPTGTLAFVEEYGEIEPLVRDSGGHVLAYTLAPGKTADHRNGVHPIVFVAEPDLMNNFGLGDPTRASAALALVSEAAYGDDHAVTFDLTLNGFGGATNLLTLAFRPPFLAATLCLLIALVIVGWRAFLRFGPAVAAKREIAFGKSGLVANTAALIVRARRLRLLTRPYATLVERRIAARLGLVRHDPEAIDAALAARWPDEESFSHYAQRLRDAHSANEILRAASALKKLEGKIDR